MGASGSTLDANQHPEDLLPTKTDLCKRYGVGTFVYRPSLHRTPCSLVGFSERVRRQGMTPSHILVDQGEITQREALQYGCYQPAIYLKRVRLVDNVAWAVHYSIVPLTVIARVRAVYGETSQANDADFSLYKALEEANVLIDHADEAINSRLATSEEAGLLGITPPSAIMVVHRKSVDADHQLVKISETVYLGEYYTYDTRLVMSHGISTTIGERRLAGTSKE